ncbi:MAG: hypoxanthine phosphoribosyltransferase [Candidatus Caenarcaniphilales bacterium]|jgi:hypoxanthine phosphoribosyltransferase|nr:hypoxanthine phosphoribosyltransferase [Candidatus Caenarcaniphilales bacterium]
MSLVISKEQIQILYSAETIATRINELAQTINQDYKDCESLVVVGVLKGAFIFAADLVRNLNLPCQLEFIRLSSYEGTQSTGTFRVYDLTLPDLHGKDILIVDDIVDSGRTAQFLLDFFNKQAGVKSVKLAALFDKPSKRHADHQKINPDYCCFTIEDKFILGYGLDYDQRFRELPYVGFISGLT